LDQHDFTGIFVGYTATDQNVKYINLTTGTVRMNHNTQFDEAWYLQPSRPLAAQLLYDLGLELGDDDCPEDAHTPIELIALSTFNNTPWPPHVTNPLKKSK
jgi:hypothetical protein